MVYHSLIYTWVKGTLQAHGCTMVISSLVIVHSYYKSYPSRQVKMSVIKWEVLTWQSMNENCVPYSRKLIFVGANFQQKPTE